ncbi:MAG: hypothetical protein AAF196_15250 [Planctomycetota bacterium]
MLRLALAPLLLSAAVCAQSSSSLTTTGPFVSGPPPMFQVQTLAAPCVGVGSTTLALNGVLSSAQLRLLAFSVSPPLTTGPGFGLVSLPTSTVVPLSNFGLPLNPGCGLGVDLGTAIGFGPTGLIRPGEISVLLDVVSNGVDIFPVGVSINLQGVALRCDGVILTTDAFTLTRTQ